MYANHGAKAAIEIALHDLLGRATGRPVHTLLGNKRRSRLPLLAVVGGGDNAGDVRDAAARQANGFTAFKIKVGVDTPANDAARARAICDVLADSCLVSADANQGFTTEEAIAFVRAVEGAGLDFLEQPVAADDLDGMAAVAAATDIAIGADEGIHSAADIARHHEHGAARGASLKSIKLGGIRAVVEAGKRADDLGMRVNVSCKTGESSIGCAAALHIASVIPNVAWGLTLTHTGLAEDVVTDPIRVERGHTDVLDRPGLGVDVDEDRVRRHRIEMSCKVDGVKRRPRIERADVGR
jgi:L-alanine-DL-glutamate epimerase-like enolase superfamily enzyme